MLLTLSSSETAEITEMYKQKAWVSFFQSCSPGHRHKVTEKLLMGCTVRQVLCSVFKCLLAHIKISQAKWDGLDLLDVGRVREPLGIALCEIPRAEKPFALVQLPWSGSIHDNLVCQLVNRRCFELPPILAFPSVLVTLMSMGSVTADIPNCWVNKLGRNGSKMGAMGELLILTQPCKSFLRATQVYMYRH